MISISHALKRNHFKMNVTQDEVFIAWITKVLKNNKALASIRLPNDGVYFEITYNGSTEEFYVDVYQKTSNYVVKL